MDVGSIEARLARVRNLQLYNVAIGRIIDFQRNLLGRVELAKAGTLTRQACPIIISAPIISQGQLFLRCERVNLFVVGERQLYAFARIDDDETIGDRHIERHSQKREALRME